MSNQPFYFFVILIAALVIWRRTRSMYRPIKGKGGRLLFPIIFLIPGLMLLENPDVHLSLFHEISAIILGMVLSFPLIWTTKYEVREDHFIYAKKDIAFVIAFLAVFVIRFALRNYLNDMGANNLAALFMLVAISYIIPWRVISFFKFRKVYNDSKLMNPTHQV